MSSEKKQIAIYEIDKNNSLFNNAENIDFLSFLLDMISKKAKEKYYSFQELTVKDDFFQNYNVKCSLLSKEFFPSWKVYLDKMLKDDLILSKSMKDTIIFFFENKFSNNTYAITFGSSGYIFIKDIIVDNFGLDMLSRISDPEKVKVKYTKQQNLTGTMQGETNLYREFQTIENILDDFGRVLQESMVNIDIEILKIFGFKQKENKRGISKKETKNCLTKDSFRINSAVEITQIESLLDGCEEIKKRKKYPINNVEILHPKQDKNLIDNLENQLFNSLFKSYNEEKGAYSYDISHKNFNEYFEASVYEIHSIKNKRIQYNEPIINIKKIFEELKNAEKGNIDIDVLKKSIKRGKITTYDADGNILTDDSIYKHIFAEETINGKKYFLLNGCWYHLIEDFIISLNDKLKSLCSNFKFTNNAFIGKWDNSIDEGRFINSHKEKPQTIIIHPNKIKNIEFCDILHYDNDNLYLYFIKQGFRNEIRTLCSQILISARLITKDLNTDKKYIKKLYEQVIKEKYSDKFDEISFLELFNKKLVFIFAFYDSKIQLNKVRLLEEHPEEFGSNIAKYSLLNLAKEIRTIDGITLQICQINK